MELSPLRIALTHPAFTRSGTPSGAPAVCAALTPSGAPKGVAPCTPSGALKRVEGEGA